MKKNKVMKAKSMKALWGSGRFKKEMHPLLKCFSYSLTVDFELLDAEIELDKAWVKMLGRVGLISKPEAAKMGAALAKVWKELKSQNPHAHLDPKWTGQYEDVHTLIQASLEKKIGNLAKKIHTGRSRNDLVVTSTRIYLRKKISEIEIRLAQLQKVLVVCAKKAGLHIIAGMTHLKKAQPVLIAHHLLAYVEMLEEDKSRLTDCLKRVDVLSLGSAALAGSSLPIDQKFLARELGFSKIAPNSMAAVSDRAFLTEFLSALAILWMHFSRLAEDFILWNSEPFGYIELDDAFATGSSLMPQKKNPDIFELVRGRSGVIFGYLQALLVVQKGLPLAYNRDLQEDKPSVFDASKKTLLTLELLALALQSVTFNAEAIEKSVEDDNLFATDILEYLVRKGVAFSEAHETVGRAVRHGLEEKKLLRDLPLEDWKNFSKVFDSDIFDLFEPASSIKAKKTIGSTHPDRVKKEIQQWEKRLR